MEWSALNVMDLLTFDLWPFKRVDQKHCTSWEAETDSIFPFPLLPFAIFMLWQLPLHQRAPAISNLYPNLFLSWEFSLSLLYYLLPISYDKYLNTSRFPPLSFNLSFILHPSFLHLLPPSLCSFFLPFSSPVPLSPSVSIFPSEFLSLFHWNRTWLKNTANIWNWVLLTCNKHRQMYTLLGLAVKICRQHCKAGAIYTGFVRILRKNVIRPR